MTPDEYRGAAAVWQWLMACTTCSIVHTWHVGPKGHNTWRSEIDGHPYRPRESAPAWNMHRLHKQWLAEIGEHAGAVPNA
jgi:hypothetical protein